MMKKLLSVFAILLILSGAAISIMKWLEIGPFAPVVEGEPVVEEEEEEDVSGEPPRFIEMEPLVIPVFKGNNVAATIQIHLQLEALGADNEALITKVMPRLSDAFLSDLYVFIPRLLKKEEHINVAILKQRLQMVADKVTRPGVINNVLVQSVVDRPAR